MGKVTLTFVTPEVDLDVNVTIDTGGPQPDIYEIFKSIRTRHKEVTLAATNEQTALNFAQAVRMDYPNLVDAASIGNVVTLTTKQSWWQIASVSGSNIDSEGITYVIENTPAETAKTLSLSGYVSGDCSNVAAEFTAAGGDSSYKAYINNVLSYDGASPFQLTLERGVNKTVRVTDSVGETIGELIVRPPRKLIAADTSIDVKNYASGATIALSTTASQGVKPIFYSLNGTEFSETGVFSGIADGDYTLSIKDVFGCVSTKDFTVDGVTELTQTVFTISEINPIRYSKIDSNRKNLWNTLSCNENKKLAYPFTHKYLEGDRVTTQFKTNASTINVYTLIQGETSPLFPIKMTENTGLEAKSTCTLFSLGGGRTGVYFGAVDILDPLTDAVIESTDFGFTLPEWANEKGKLVTIDGIGQVSIDRIGYSEEYESWILEIVMHHSPTPSSSTLYAQYNLQPYEVYEFETTVSGSFNIVIEADDITYVSEKIKAVEDNNSLFEIRYKDSVNRGDMVYSTGIEHLIRLEGYSDYQGEQDTDGYNGDTMYHTTDNTVFSSEQFVFPRISSMMAHKLRLIMAHSFLQINGILYKISEAPEINGNINNNFKTFLVSLKSGGDAFLDEGQEIITGSLESESLGGAIEASRGNSLILWTKNS